MRVEPRVSLTAKHRIPLLPLLELQLQPVRVFQIFLIFFSGIYFFVAKSRFSEKPLRITRMGIVVKRENSPGQQDPTPVRAWVRERVNIIYRKAVQITKDKERRERIKTLLKALAVEMNKVSKVCGSGLQLFTG